MDLTWEQARELAAAAFTGQGEVVVGTYGLEDATHWGVPIDVYWSGGGPHEPWSHLIPGGGCVLVAKADGALTLPASIPDWPRLDAMERVGNWP